MTWDFLLFQRRDVKLQIDTKVNVLELELVQILLKNVKHMKKGEPWNNSTISEGPVHDMRPCPCVIITIIPAVSYWLARRPKNLKCMPVQKS